MGIASWLDGYLLYLQSLESDSRRRAAISKLKETDPQHAALLLQEWEKKKGKL